jgi:hypothetical protein
MKRKELSISCVSAERDDGCGSRMERLKCHGMKNRKKTQEIEDDSNSIVVEATSSFRCSLAF